MKKKEKSNQNKQEKSLQKDIKKESFGTRFINTIKKRWLISGTNTILLIAILIAIVILINTFVQSLEITPIDCTSNKQYTLTEESKEKISKIETDINIYFVGYEDSEKQVTLAKQYNKENEHIKVETIDANERTDIASKYSVTNDYHAIIVENGEKSATLYSDDLYTYDSSYNTIDLTEEKITSAILNVTTDKIPKIYFLTGYSNYSLDNEGQMYYLSLYLKNEVLNYESLNMLTAGAIPEDCSTLVITTPTKDFDELTTNEIIKYINNGGNILWLNSAYAEKVELKNVNKILALYAIDPFDEGYIYETNQNKIALGYPGCILEDLGNTEIDKKLQNILVLNSTKINVNTDKQSELGVEGQTMITSSNTSYFRKDTSKTSSSTDGDEQGEFTIAGIYTKTISKDNSEGNDESENEASSEENSITSKLVIFGDNNFISDNYISNEYGKTDSMILLCNNKDVMLNSIAYLTEQKSDITIRKSYNQTSSFTATDGQKAVIIRIIFMVPIGVILFGVLVWQVRRRKK